MRIDNREDLARRLAAAVISYNQGLKGVDYMLGKLREMRPDKEVGAFWLSIADSICKELDEDMNTKLDSIFSTTEVQ